MNLHRNNSHLDPISSYNFGNKVLIKIPSIIAMMELVGDVAKSSINAPKPNIIKVHNRINTDTTDKSRIPSQSSSPIIIGSETGDRNNKVKSKIRKYPAMLRKRLLLVDPSFSNFNIHEYEQELMKHKEEGKYDFKAIAYKDGNESPQKELAPVESSSVSVLKPAPTLSSDAEYFDANSKTDVSSTSVKNDDKDKKTPKDKDTKDNRINFQGLPPIPSPRTKRDSLIDKDFDSLSSGNANMHWKINQHNEIYKKELEALIKEEGFDDVERLQELIKVYKWWTNDLTAQNDMFLKYFDEFQQSVKNDYGEFTSEMQDLKNKLQVTYTQMLQARGKTEGIETENNKLVLNIHKLNQELLSLKLKNVDKDESIKELETDIETLGVIIQRVMKRGVWDIDGLNLSPRIFKDIFNSRKELFGKQALRDILEGVTDTKLCLKELQEERDVMLQELEHFRSKIFSKERRLQKLNIEEQSIKSRIEFYREEENSLKEYIADLKSEKKALVEITAGKCDTTLSEIN